MRGFSLHLGLVRAIYPGFSFNPRMLTVLTSDCITMHKLPGAQNFSDVQGKPIALRTGRHVGRRGKPGEWGTRLLVFVVVFGLVFLLVFEVPVLSPLDFHPFSLQLRSPPWIFEGV